MLYVLTTRQTHDLMAFVDDKEKLIENLQSEAKTSSLEEQKELLKDLTEQLQAMQKVETGVDYNKTADNFFNAIDKMEREDKVDRQRLSENEQQLSAGGLDVQQHDHQQHQQEQQLDQGMVMDM